MHDLILVLYFYSIYVNLYTYVSTRQLLAAQYIIVDNCICNTEPSQCHYVHLIHVQNTAFN